MLSIIHDSGFGSPARICCPSASESARASEPEQRLDLGGLHPEGIVGLHRSAGQHGIAQRQHFAADAPGENAIGGGLLALARSRRAR